MQLTKPKAVVTTAISLPSLLPSLPEVTICNTSAPSDYLFYFQGTKLILVGPGSPNSSAIPLSSLLASNPADDGLTSSTPASHLDTVALMPFSSGTTGLPKAVGNQNEKNIILTPGVSLPPERCVSPHPNSPPTVWQCGLGHECPLPPAHVPHVRHDHDLDHPVEGELGDHPPQVQIPILVP